MDHYKFDLRVYVLVVSCDPLRLFLYNDGLVCTIAIATAKQSVRILLGTTFNWTVCYANTDQFGKCVHAVDNDVMIIVLLFIA